MKRKPYRIPKAWRRWGGGFNTLTSIGEWDVTLWHPPDSSGDFILLHTGGLGYGCIRMHDGLESLCINGIPTEVFTFARNYRAFVS